MTPFQFHLTLTHLPAAHRLADDLAGLFPDRAAELREVAEQAMINAAIRWLPGCTVEFEAFAGARVRGSLALYTAEWSTGDTTGYPS